MFGYLQKARVVAFKSKDLDKHGNVVWQVFISPPTPREYAAAAPLNGDTASSLPANTTNRPDTEIPF
jgi:hypothetical protein